MGIRQYLIRLNKTDFPVVSSIPISPRPNTLVPSHTIATLSHFAV